LLNFGMGNEFVSFRRANGGIWICVEPVTMNHPKGPIQVTRGSSFKKGTDFMGVDVAAWLDEQLVSAMKKRD